MNISAYSDINIVKPIKNIRARIKNSLVNENSEYKSKALIEELNFPFSKDDKFKCII
jgi:hypothetical protein